MISVFKRCKCYWGVQSEMTLQTEYGSIRFDTISWHISSSNKNLHYNKL